MRSIQYKITEMDEVKKFVEETRTKKSEFTQQESAAKEAAEKNLQNLNNL